MFLDFSKSSSINSIFDFFWFVSDANRSKLKGKDTAAIVNKIARLARLEIPEKNKQNLTNDLNNILEFVAQLNEVDTSNVEPLASVTGHKLPLRSDEVTDGNIEELVLKNAPESSSGFFVVPKVIE